MLKRFFHFIILLFTCLIVEAREGMWLPMLLDRNIEEMRNMGSLLTPEDIYSVNNASLKDAIVLFGSGCTGEVISSDGLVLTNHHCGFSAIQQLSSPENDYLSEGYWAMNGSEELPNKGLSVTFLIEMRDVTNQVLEGTDSLITENAISDQIRANCAILVDQAIDGTHYKASIKSFFSQNQYFLILTETFTDIRLVGAPPSSIGNFGGDTDNWMWPRHTGDFAIFRIYANSDNKPAAYSPDNVPYKPKKHLSINLKGIKDGDFAMTYGFPGTTQKHLYSKAVEQIINQRNPDRIAIRTEKLKTMWAAMNANHQTRIKYASKERTTSNSWKKWQGESKGLIKLNAVDVKVQEEQEFQKWVNASNERKFNYGNILNSYSKLYDELVPYQKAKDYFDEAIARGSETYAIFRHFDRSFDNPRRWQISTELDFLSSHFKDFELNLDRELFQKLVLKYATDLPTIWHPESLNVIFNRKNTEQSLIRLYKKSILTNEQALKKLIAQNDIALVKKQLQKDKLYQLYNEFQQVYYDTILGEYNRINSTLKQVQTEYVKALMEMNADKLMYPDANQTLRLSYGKIEGYRPKDGVKYHYYTTIDGIIEKDNNKVYEFKVPERLKTLYKNKDYGRYSNLLGELPVCFIASNHTTGGNSGSPVLDQNGYLIGINFDRCWEGTMSDIMFDPDVSRNISVDIRYILFIVDKFANAGHLLEEMTILE